MLFYQPTLSSLKKVTTYSNAGKLGRLLKNPVDWCFAVLFRKVLYRRRQQAVIRKRPLFFGLPFHLPLPAATDIFLSGGKTHPSETRLAAYMIQAVNNGQTVLDIGAHCGYFSALAAALTGASGKVFSFEPSDLAFSVLAMNAKDQPTQKIFKEVVAEAPGLKTFYEFPGQFAEFSSMDIAQYLKEPWLEQHTPKEHQIKATTIDQICKEEGVVFDFVKIDVEGAEDRAILGGKEFFTSHSPVLALEYLHPEQGNETHKRATSQLKEWGYATFLPDEKGMLYPVADIDAYLRKEGLESDNVIFKKGDPKEKH